MAYLTIHAPHADPQRMMLTGPTVVGRAIGSTLWIDDAKLSREHCRVEPRGERWRLVDLKSRNGTFVNSRMIDTIELEDGMTFEVGRSKIEFHEGTFVAHRPADPIEAALIGPGLLATRGTIAQCPETGSQWNRPLPVVHHPGQHISSHISVEAPGATPLAFTRPPARPMPRGTAKHQADSNDPTPWYRVLSSRLNRQ